MQFDGQHIAITGASSGIGREMALALAPRAKALVLLAWPILIASRWLAEFIPLATPAWLDTAVGVVALAAGFALLSQRVLTGGLAVAAIACFVLHSRREEAHCLRVFGDDYRRYMQRVPAFNVLRGLWRRVRHARS